MIPPSTRDLLQALALKGISVHADGVTLRVEADPGAIQAADLDTLRSHKAAILAYLERIGRATSDAAAVLEAIRRRILWADHLRLEDRRDARPPTLAVLAEYQALADAARERFDADRLEEITEGVKAFAARWGLSIPSRDAAA